MLGTLSIRRFAHELRLGLLLCALMGVVGGCAAQRGSELIEILGVRDDILRDGDSLRVIGEGFPARGEGELILRGHTFRPGEGAAAITATFGGKLRSAEEFEVELDSHAIAALGGRGTFRGELELRFSGEAGSVSGRLPGVVLDIEPMTREAFRAAERLEESARRFFGNYGLQLIALGGEVLIERVEPGSLADEAGLKAGDRILELAGVRAYRIADLAPANHRPSHPLLLVPAESDAPIRLEIHALASGQMFAPFHTALIALAALFIAFVIFGATTARYFTVLTREAPADGEGSLGWYFFLPSAEQRTGAPLSGLFSALSAALGLGFLTLAFIGVYVLLERMNLSAGLWITLSFSLALRLVSRFDRDVRLSLISRLLPWVALMTPLILTLSTFSLIIGSADLRVIAEGQGAHPWQWNLFREPLFFLLFPAFALAAFGRLELRPHERGVSGFVTRLNVALLSALATMIFLGGGNIERSLELTGASKILLPALVFALKSIGVLLFGLYLRRSALGRANDGWRFALPLSMAGLALGSVHLFVEFPQEVQLIAGPLLFAAAILSLVGLVAHRFFFTRRQPLLYPFL